MKNILIVGGAGFIGSNLCDSYIREGHRVTVLDNLCTGSKHNLDGVSASRNFAFLEGDVCELLPEFEETFDYVFHLASPASPPKYMALAVETMMSNSVGTKNLLDYCTSSGARLLFTSTSEVYGDPTVSPQSESYWGNVNPTGPRSTYDESKRFGEALISEYQRSKGVSAVIVRLFNTYGPKMDPFDGRVVSNFIRQTIEGSNLTVYGDGSQTRSFCYVSDTVRGLKMAMESNELGPLNIGNPTEMTLLELAAIIGKTLGKAPLIEFDDLPTDDPKQRKPDISLAQAKLNWNPTVALDEGIKLTYDWMKGELQQ